MSDLGLWPVPTLRQLVKGGRSDLVVAIAWNKDGEPTQFRTTPEGHAHLGNLMQMNALVRRAKGEGDWRQPRSRLDIVEKLEDAS